MTQFKTKEHAALRFALGLCFKQNQTWNVFGFSAESSTCSTANTVLRLTCPFTLPAPLCKIQIQHNHSSYNVLFG